MGNLKQPSKIVARTPITGREENLRKAATFFWAKFEPELFGSVWIPSEDEGGTCHILACQQQPCPQHCRPKESLPGWLLLWRRNPAEFSARHIRRKGRNISNLQLLLGPHLGEQLD